MVSPEHIEKQPFEDPQAPSPVVGKEEVVEHTRAWQKPGRRILGAALPLLGGISWTWSLLSLNLGVLAFVVLVAVFVLGAVSFVLLFPLKWAVAVVPQAFATGELLTFFVGAGFYSTWAGYTATATFSVFVPLGVLAGFVATLAGALIAYGAAKTA